MKKIYIVLVAILAVLLFITGLKASAQKVVYPHNVFWSKTEINQLGKNYQWGWGADVVYRRKSGLEDKSMLYAPLRFSFRPWVHYQFSPNARLSLSPIGYVRNHEYYAKPEDLLRPPNTEWRTTLQYFHHFKPGNPRFMHTWRYRYEMRWQEVPLQNTWRFFNRFRIRYRLRYTFIGSDFYENNNMYAMVSNEIGLNFGRNVTFNTFNQNRFYAGIGYRFLNTVRAEVRYVNRFRTRGATGFEFDHGRGLMLTLYVDQLKGLGKQEAYKIQFTD